MADRERPDRPESVEPADGPESSVSGPFDSVGTAREGAPDTAAGAPHTASRATPTVQGAVADHGDDQVLVTALIDGVLRRHQRDYLRGRPTRAPSWPADGPRQPAWRWLEEARVLLAEGQVFGRAAVVAWSLLDDAVAHEAVSSGVLGGLADEMTPSLADHLSPAGVELLRRRAPLVALQEGLLEASVALPVDPDLSVRALALHRPPTTVRQVGRWALAFTDRVVAGQGSTFARVYPPEPRSDETTEGGVAVTTVGWSRRGRLFIVVSAGDDGGVVRWDPVRGQVLPLEEGWPYAAVAAVAEDGLVVAGGAEGETKVWWGNTDSAYPVALPPVEEAPVRLAVSQEWTSALLADGTMRVLDGKGLVNHWVTVGRSVSATARTADHYWYGTERGEVGSVDLAAPTAGGTVTALPDQRVDSLAVGGPWLLAVSSREVAVLRAGALVARWDIETGPDPQQVALSADGKCLGICGGGWLRIWRVDAEPELRLTSYLADTPRGDDLLNIKPARDALAALICAHVVQPPLSIGLFGPWGSGKSFFMHSLQERVQQVTDQARDSGRPQSALWAWRNVRQVEFNAWHYASADVWAGLLEQLIRGISIPRAGKGVPLDLPEGLQSAQELRVRRLLDAQASLDTAREKLVAAEREGARDVLATVASDTLTALDGALAKAELSPVGKNLSTTVNEVIATRAALKSAGWLGPTSRRELLRTVVKAAVVAVVVLAVVVGVLVAWPGADALAWGPLAALVSAAAGVATWVGERARRYAARLEGVASVQQLLPQAQAELDDAHKAVEESTVGGLLTDYLHSRDTSEDYRGSLGLIGTVHRDLRTFSDGVAMLNETLLASPEASQEPGADAVNRVVLYIDDLDRCPPAVVVRVLEAVSMLLSFELFVVVVAVDAHWVSKSLATMYPTLLRDGDVTADNYLEKIFQLPVWLDRPAPDAARTMARTLLGSAAREEDSPPRVDEPSASPAIGLTRPPTGSGPAVTASVTAEGTPGGTGLATSPPAPLALDDAEARAIEALAPMLARSPRALKRYINTYRLLKGLIEQEQLESARLLLAVATGRPTTGERLLDQIRAAEDGSTLGDLVGGWPQSDRDWFTHCVPAELRQWSSWPALSLAPAAEAVVKFVFRSSQMSEVKDDSPPADPGA